MKREVSPLQPVVVRRVKL